MSKVTLKQKAIILIVSMMSIIICGYAFNEGFMAQAEARQYLVDQTETKSVVFDIYNEEAPDWIKDYAKESETEPIEEDISDDEYYEEDWYYEPYYDYVEPEVVEYNEPDGDALTKSQGVNYYDGRKETWYSSNILYHHRTSEWHVDDNGVYRDDDGYVVVAASDLDQGDTVETSHGTGKVYDSGCAAGTTDIYVAW